MALMPKVEGKENKKPLSLDAKYKKVPDDDDDFIPVKKKPKIKLEDLKKPCLNIHLYSIQV